VSFDEVAEHRLSLIRKHGQVARVYEQLVTLGEGLQQRFQFNVLRPSSAVPRPTQERHLAAMEAQAARRVILPNPARTLDHDDHCCACCRAPKRRLVGQVSSWFLARKGGDASSLTDAPPSAYLPLTGYHRAKVLQVQLRIGEERLRATT